MSGRGHRKLRLSSKKYYERNKAKKAKALLLSTPYDESASVPDTSTLLNQLQLAKALDRDWKVDTIDTRLVLYKLSSVLDRGTEIEVAVTVEENFQFSVAFHSTVVGTESSVLKDIHPLLNTVAKVKKLLETLDSSCACVGNGDEEFLALSSVRKGIMKDQSKSSIVAVVESARTGFPSIFHTKCDVIVSQSTPSSRCTACTQHRRSLSKLVSRAASGHSDDHTHPSSHAPHNSLTTPESIERLRRLHSQVKNSKLQLKRLKLKVSRMIETEITEVDEEMDDDIRKMVKDHEKDVKAEHPEGSFQRLFWDEQVKASMVKDKKSMRWHPTFIRWCLYLRHVSGKAYEILRKSECISLPSQRTLRDYTHYVSVKIGFCEEVDQMLVSALDTSVERNRYVVLVMDEVHIRDGLVFDKHEGKIIGFVDLGETNNYLLDLAQSKDEDRQLAKSMLVLMVRGLFTCINFPYAQFASHTLSGELLVDPVWQAISRLERQGIRVMALVCDGASTNRKLWKLHSTAKGLIYKVPNVFAPDEPRSLYFIADPPHLLKTIRNAWWSPKRTLWREGKHINWEHLERLYKHDTGADSAIAGLRLVPKIKFEHVYLNSFSKMRVDLAAQVLSETVGNALEVVVGDEASETIRFVKMIDRFFDSLNVNNFSSGKRKRKVFQNPYLSPYDFRFEWLETEFLPYLKQWEDSVQARRGFSAKAKGNMLLSSETRLGIRVTVQSFLELGRILLRIPGVNSFLSERLSQDPLEKFFGCQRQRGGASENPSVAEFSSNTQALRVADTICMDVAKGNCRGNVEQTQRKDDQQPLSKRRRKHK